MSKVTQITRIKELDGTYEVELVEKSRKKILPRDELIEVLQGIVDEVRWQEASQQHLTSLKEDPARGFARRFVTWIEEHPELFETVLQDAERNPNAE